MNSERENKMKAGGGAGVKDEVTEKFEHIAVCLVRNLSLPTIGGWCARLQLFYLRNFWRPI